MVVWFSAAPQPSALQGSKAQQYLVIPGFHYHTNTHTHRFGGGVPGKQYDLIKEDGQPVDAYIARTFDGVAEHSHLRTSNYFYYNCLMGHFLKDNCPAYLTEDGFRRLKVRLCG
jgi:hypothetical protein